MQNKKFNCKLCNIEKDLELFPYEKSKNGKYYYRKTCKTCREEKRKIYYFNSKKEYLESKKKYYIKNKVEITNKKIKYYNENKKVILQSNKNYRRKNIEITLYNNAKKRAIGKNYNFNITPHDIKNKLIEITDEIGNFICPLLKIIIQVNDKTCFNSISLDRINNDLGYDIDNINIISHIANASKNNFSFEEYNFRTNRFILMMDNKLFTKLGVQDCCYNINYKKNVCKHNNIKFELNKQYVNSIYPQNGLCPICLNEFKYKTEFAPSLDRFNPLLGYIKNNVNIICFACNRMKQNLSIKELVIIRDNWKKIL